MPVETDYSCWSRPTGYRNNTVQIVKPVKFGLNLEQKRAGDPANLPATAKRTQHLIKMPQSDLHILIKFALLPEKEKRNKG